MIKKLPMARRNGPKSEKVSNTGFSDPDGNRRIKVIW